MGVDVSSRLQSATRCALRAGVWTVLTVTVAIASTAGLCQSKDDNYGFYTDAPSYERDTDIVIHGNWPIPSGPSTKVEYKLWRIGRTATTFDGPATRNWDGPVASTTAFYESYFDRDGNEVAYPIPPTYGSFVEFGYSIQNRRRVTLEGWIYPTTTQIDAGPSAEDIAIMGHLEDGSTSGGGLTVDLDGTVGIGIATGPEKLVAIVKTVGGQEVLLESDVTLAADTWHHVGITYNDGKFKLYLDGRLTDQDLTTITGTINQKRIATIAGLPLRIGAKAEAPGSLTGLFDGRVDNWKAWGSALPLCYFRAQFPRDEGVTPNAVANGGTVSMGREGGNATTAALVFGGDICLLPTNPLMDIRFNDTYGTVAVDSSGNGRDGTVVNHGTPGMSGVNGNGQSLRLNFDQSVDVDWPDPLVEEPPMSGTKVEQEVRLPIPGSATSGLYVIEAVVNDEPFAPDDLPLQYRMVVVRPKLSDPPGDVAVVLPLNTWLAYNGWPGGQAQSFPAPGLPPRAATNPGNNSAYGKMGDANSFAHFQGLRRPSPTMSPYSGDSTKRYFSVLGAGSVMLVEWMEDAAATLRGDGIAPDCDPATLGCGFTYDVFTDWDLERQDSALTDGLEIMPNPTTRYDTWITVAHHEYWGPKALDFINFHGQAGGDVLSVAGNMFLWRSDVSETTSTIETRKWPQRLGLMGARDGQSLIGNRERTGGWRFVNQCLETTTMPDPKTDYVLANITDTNACEGSLPEFPAWRPVPSMTGHWLFQDAVFGVEDNRFGATPIPLTGGGTAFSVGHESDRYVQGRDPLGLSGSVEIVAQADPENLCPLVLTTDWTDSGTGEVHYDPDGMPMSGDEVFIYRKDSTTCDDLSTIPQSSGFWGKVQATMLGNFWSTKIELFAQTFGVGATPHASLVHFDHTGGGHVVSIPSTAATWSLGYVRPSGNVDPLTAVAERALKCMLYGSGNCTPPPGP